MLVSFSKYLRFSNSCDNSVTAEGNRSCSALARIRGRYVLSGEPEGI